MKFNNKGFTLILVLLVIAILSILGTTLLGITVANYKMKVVNTKAKQSFYLSEAGLEESYAKVYILIEDSIGRANDAVEEFLDGFSYENELLKESSPYIDENGQINEEYLYDQMDWEFEKAFEANVKEYIKDTIEIESPYEYNNIKYDSIVVLEPNPEFNAGIMEVKIKSTSSVDEVKRTSQVTLIIITPDYNGSYHAENNGTTQVSDDHILTKVISADNNINFNSGTNNIHGNIMAKNVIGNTENIHGDISTSNGNLGVNSQLTSNKSVIKIIDGIDGIEIINIANTNNTSNVNDICLLGRNYSKVSLHNNVNNAINRANKIDLSNLSEPITYSGIIISKQDIYIVGDINFTGTIISRKDVNIYTYDESNFHYDANYIENTIDENGLSGYFEKYNSDIFEQNINFSSVLTINNQNPEDFIELKDWQIPY